MQEGGADAGLAYLPPRRWFTDNNNGWTARSATAGT
jgi:hypothetical protein